MAQIIVTIPDTQLARVLDAFVLASLDPLAPMPVLTQPQKLALLKARLARYVKDTVLRVEREAQVRGLAAPTDPGVS